MLVFINALVNFKAQLPSQFELEQLLRRSVQHADRWRQDGETPSELCRLVFNVRDGLGGFEQAGMQKVPSLPNSCVHAVLEKHACMKRVLKLYARPIFGLLQ